jgi:hypothetical protein
MIVAPPKEQQRSKLVLAEALAGMITGFCVSPLNTVVDKSVMEYANKKEPTIWSAAGKSIKTLMIRPLTFLGGFEFRWMCFVYLPTFGVSNIMDHFSPVDGVPHPIQKLFAVFLTNTVTSLMKDRVYAQHLNPHKPIEAFPISSLMLLFTRDILSMAAAFTMPPILAKWAHDKHGYNYNNAERVFQIACPPLLQIFVVPIHLLALGLYNEKEKTLGQHLPTIRKMYFSTVALRMLRFLPGYGIGGIFNIELRKLLKARVPYE